LLHMLFLLKGINIILFSFPSFHLASFNLTSIS
jgi:hypothetical protein